ncbi:MAG: CDP-glycerol glycerophosphotransferase family protein, partial [Candidatus Thermoplasmatota archaeon]|nr:CDP-glycerol glycerophosphotransferase family protein [Candidatus Thermoplasmatota archaeon]
PEQIATQIMDFYNQYDLKVSGKINNQTAYELIKTIEETYQTDTIQLSDGTRIWNLLRIFLYSHFQKPDDNTIKKKLSKNNIKSIFSVFKEGFVPLNLPNDITVCGFSSSESRKLYHDTYYDIYLDPLYDILGDTLAVFEWPETTGYRRKYDKPVYSRHHVPMHFPIWTKTYWDLLLNKVIGRKNFSLQSDELLKQIIQHVSAAISVDTTKLTKDINDFITVFVAVKYFLLHMLLKIRPKTVLIRCGYGRFPMALSQACKELNISAVELQHGLITAYLPAYRRSEPTTNKDCLPEFLLAQGEIYAELVRNGNIFNKNKVISVGYPYLEQTLTEQEKKPALKHSFSPFQRNILFTSQWIMAAEIQDFVIKVAVQIEQENKDVGILFKPHPYDKNDYSQLIKHKHIILADKYEDTFKLFTLADIHSTIYSTSGLEAMAFGTPNIFVDLYNLIDDNTTPYLVHSPTQFVTSMTTLLENYKDAVLETKAVASLFFTPSPKQHLIKFFTDLKIL